MDHKVRSGYYDRPKKMKLPGKTENERGRTSSITHRSTIIILISFYLLFIKLLVVEFYFFCVTVYTLFIVDLAVF